MILSVCLNKFGHALYAGGVFLELKVTDIYKSFGEKEVLKGIHFTARSGRAVGLLGRNGAGKTTTIRIVMDFFQPDRGEVLIDERPVAKSAAKIGYLPEERGLYPKKKIGEQMIYFACLRGMRPAEAEASVKYWLKQVELEEYYDKKLDTLSKGNQQKIQLALTMVDEPDIIILDEPFSGLDPVNAKILKRIVEDLTHQNKIVLFSSHQMAYVEAFCDDILILNQGVIALQGALREIKRGYPRNQLRIIPDQDPAVFTELLRAPGMAARVRSYSAKGDIFLVELTAPEMKDLLLQDMLAQHITFSCFEVAEPSLEEIFISVAGRQDLTDGNV